MTWLNMPMLLLYPSYIRRFEQLVLCKSYRIDSLDFGRRSEGIETVKSCKPSHFIKFQIGDLDEVVVEGIDGEIIFNRNSSNENIG
jgi:hypothetical protein